MAHDVFISHSAKDKTVANAVCATLEANGIRCFIAPRDILPGADWGEAILDAITDCRLMIIIVSSNANASHQIKREVERAVNRGAILIPFRIEDVPLSKSLEFFISTAHWLDALTPPMEKHLQHLTETTQLLLRRSGPRPEARRSCARCGGNVPSTSRFCPLCGEPRPVDPPQTYTPAPQGGPQVTGHQFAAPQFAGPQFVGPQFVGSPAQPNAARAGSNSSISSILKVAGAAIAIAVAVAVTYIIMKPAPVDPANRNVQGNVQPRGTITNERAQGQATQTLEYYNEAIKRNPQDASAYLGRGEVYRLKSDYDRALADYNEAIKIEPKNAAAYSARGRVYILKRDYDRALADYQEASRLDPNDEMAKKMVGRVEVLRRINRP